MNSAEWGLFWSRSGRAEWIGGVLFPAGPPRPGNAASCTRPEVHTLLTELPGSGPKGNALAFPGERSWE